MFGELDAKQLASKIELLMCLAPLDITNLSNCLHNVPCFIRVFFLVFALAFLKIIMQLL